MEERATNLKENQQSFFNTHPVLARTTGFGRVQNNKDTIQEYNAGFDAEMAELVEERDVTHPIN